MTNHCQREFSYHQARIVCQQQLWFWVTRPHATRHTLHRQTDCPSPFGHQKRLRGCNEDLMCDNNNQRTVLRSGNKTFFVHNTNDNSISTRQHSREVICNQTINSPTSRGVNSAFSMTSLKHSATALVTRLDGAVNTDIIQLLLLTRSTTHIFQRHTDTYANTSNQRTRSTTYQ